MEKVANCSFAQIGQTTGNRSDGSGFITLAPSFCCFIESPHPTYMDKICSEASVAVFALAGYMYSIAIGGPKNQQAQRRIRPMHARSDMRVSCLRERHTTPHLLARLCRWDATLDDVARRVRCSVCGEKQCTARAVPMITPCGSSNDVLRLDRRLAPVHRVGRRTMARNYLPLASR